MKKKAISTGHVAHRIAATISDSNQNSLTYQVNTVVHRQRQNRLPSELNSYSQKKKTDWKVLRVHYV